MKRYFLVLATGSSLLLLAAFGLGLWFLWERSQGQAAPDFTGALGNDGFTWHMGVAILAVLAALFTHCLAFTYLLGTGKWVQEVASAYDFPADGWPAQVKQLKSNVTKSLLVAMAVSILAAVSGAGAQTGPGSAWTPAHALLAVLVLFVNGYAFWREYEAILANEKVLIEVKAAADAKRGDEPERGASAP